MEERPPNLTRKETNNTNVRRRNDPIPDNRSRHAQRNRKGPHQKDQKLHVGRLNCQRLACQLKPTLRGKRKGGPGRRGEEDTQGLTFTIASRAQKPGAEEEEGKGGSSLRTLTFTNTGRAQRVKRCDDYHSMSNRDWSLVEERGKEQDLYTLTSAASWSLCVVLTQEEEQLYS